MNGSHRFACVSRRLHGSLWRTISRLVLCLALLSITWCLASPAQAGTTPLPASAYPPHTKITYFPRLTNQEFDCVFGWYCYGDTRLPSLHYSTEDALHRTGGWASWGEPQGNDSGTMWFELYSSVYSGEPAYDAVTWNQIAAADEQIALEDIQRSTNATTIPSVLPSGVRGEVFAAYVDGGIWHIFFLTA